MAQRGIDKKERSLIAEARGLWSAFSDVGVTTHASSVAYYTFLSLVPILAIAISLLSVLGINEQEVVAFFTTLMPDAFDGIAENLVNDAFARSGIAFSLSSVVLLWSASKGARALATGLNSAYGKKDKRNAIVSMLLSIAVGLCLVAVVTAAVYVVFSDTIFDIIASVFPGFEGSDILSSLANKVAIVALVTVLTALCYSWLPAGKRKVIPQIPGAFLATVACFVLSLGFRIYVDNFAEVTALYGTLAAVALMLLWLYLLSFAVITGAFVNRLIADKKRKSDDVDEGGAEEAATE